MFDKLEQMIIDLDKGRFAMARAFVDWVVSIVEKPAKLLTRPKSERPVHYEVVDPEIARLHWLEQNQQPRD